MKKFVMCCLAVVLSVLIIVPTAFAASYEYIIDNSNLFDDSNDMISMAKEIRNKLDFNIHIYSVSSLENIQSIVDEYLQDSSAFIIFISEDYQMTWYSGSIVQKTIRDVDLEILFSSAPTNKNQYTKSVNFILSKVLSIYVYGEETIDDFTIPSDYADENNTGWFWLNFNYAVNFIKTHPVRILLIIVLLVVLVFYYRKRSSEKE